MRNGCREVNQGKIIGNERGWPGGLSETVLLGSSCCLLSGFVHERTLTLMERVESSPSDSASIDVFGLSQLPKQDDTVAKI